jgi:hypothetical protein
LPLQHSNSTVGDYNENEQQRDKLINKNRDIVQVSFQANSDIGYAAHNFPHWNGSGASYLVVAALLHSRRLHHNFLHMKWRVNRNCQAYNPVADAIAKLVVLTSGRKKGTTSNNNYKLIRTANDYFLQCFNTMFVNNQKSNGEKLLSITGRWLVDRAENVTFHENICPSDNMNPAPNTEVVIFALADNQRARNFLPELVSDGLHLVFGANFRSRGPANNMRYQCPFIVLLA